MSDQSSAYKLVSFGLNSAFFFIFTTMMVQRIFSVKARLDQAALITLIFYELYFLCTFANWVTYFLADGFFLNDDSVDVNTSKMVNNYFYVGDYTSTFMIFISHTFFTFEMYLIKVCLQSKDMNEYQEGIRKSKQIRTFIMTLQVVFFIISEVYYIRRYFLGY